MSAQGVYPKAEDRIAIACYLGCGRVFDDAPADHAAV